MPNVAARVCNRGLDGVVSEKRVFIRSSRATHYVHLTPLSQIGCVLLIVAGLAAALYGGMSLLLNSAATEQAMLERDALTLAFEARISALEAERDALAADLDETRAHHEGATAALGETQGRLVEAHAALRGAQTEARGLRAKLATLTDTRLAQTSRIEALEADLREAQLAMLDGLAAPRFETSTDLLPSATLTGAMADVIAERDQALADRSRIEAEARTLVGELEAWREREKILLGRVEDAVRAGLGGLTKVLERADLDIEKILSQARHDYSGSGGPFEPLTEAEAAAMDEGEADLRVAALMRDLERVNLMRVAVDRLPFGLPVKGARLTSGFGKRRDPFRRRWSMHNGVDYAGPSGTEITTTADGVVSFAGRMSGYGKIVVIRHAFGYETRYAHLRRMTVEAGQRVSRGDVIGQMGNTGRSTGSHLHYEIRIGDDPINPAKFIEATRDVL